MSTKNAVASRKLLNARTIITDQEMAYVFFFFFINLSPTRNVQNLKYVRSLKSRLAYPI